MESHNIEIASATTAQTFWVLEEECPLQQQQHAPPPGEESISEEANSTVLRKRGRKKGTKVKCSYCGAEGHNVTTCPQKASTLAAMGGPLAEENAQLKQELVRVKESLAKRDREVEMLKSGTEHVIYGIYDMEKEYACFSDPVYVGKSTDFRRRAYAHKSDGGALRKMGRDDKRGVIVALRRKWFKDEEKGKEWVATWESYYMMLYGQHKYNTRSYNTNSVGTMDEQMKALRKKKEALEALPMDDILRDDAKIEELSRVLCHYGEYVQADQEAKKQSSSSSSEDGN